MSLVLARPPQPLMAIIVWHVVGGFLFRRQGSKISRTHVRRMGGGAPFGTAGAVASEHPQVPPSALAYRGNARMLRWVGSHGFRISLWRHAGLDFVFVWGQVRVFRAVAMLWRGWAHRLRSLPPWGIAPLCCHRPIPPNEPSLRFRLSPPQH